MDRIPLPSSLRSMLASGTAEEIKKGARKHKALKLVSPKLSESQVQHQGLCRAVGDEA